MAAELRLRAWRGEDAAATRRLFFDTVRGVNRRDYSQAQVEAWAPEAADLVGWRARLDASQCWIAEQGGGEVLGFINLTPAGVVDMLFVGKDCQGRGIASLLLAELEAAARQLGLASLTTDASITARPFFEARGFVLAAAQDVELRGQTLRNYRMVKPLS